MTEIVIRPRAFSDLEEIWLYSRENWGDEQAARYLGQLNDRIRELAKEPEQGRSRDAIRAGYSSIHVGRHLVFYTREADTLRVERVLHDQMDFDRHLW